MPSITELSKSRGTIHRIHPDDIIADHKHNGRHDESPEPKDIIRSFLEVGQLQPVGIRPNPDKELGPLLAFGFRRLQAARVINERGLTGPAHDGSEPFLLECKILDKPESSDFEAFKRNVAENYSRTNANPLDDAHNLHRLIHDFGLSQTEAAAVFGESPNFASRRLSLLTLSPEVQRRIANGEMSANAAEEIAKADAPLKAELEAKVEAGELGSGGKITKAAVVEVVREDALDEAKKKERRRAKAQAAAKAEAAESEDENDGAGVGEAVEGQPVQRKRGRPKSATPTRTLKEVKVMLAALGKDEEPDIQALGMLLEQWLLGKLTDKGLRRKLEEMVVKG
jgi:ParB-like chromosome segregation protein Spo0J